MLFIWLVKKGRGHCWTQSLKKMTPLTCVSQWIVYITEPSCAGSLYEPVLSENKCIIRVHSCLANLWGFNFFLKKYQLELCINTGICLIIYLNVGLTLITPAPVCANIIQKLVHPCRGLGCSIFIEINVKSQSNPSPFKVFNIQHCSAHIQPSTIISKYHFKKCVPFRHNSRGN